MIDQFEIFKRLREYEAEPPAEVSLRIFNSLEAYFKKKDDTISTAQLEQLQELEIIPPPSIYTAIEHRAITAFQLSFLKNYQVAPPGWAYNSISEKIQTGKKLKKIGGRAIVKTIYRYRAAIGIILIAGIGWFTWQLATSPVKPVAEAAANNTKRDEMKNDSTSNKANEINDNRNVTVAPVKNINEEQTKVTVQGERIMMSVDEYKFPVMNDDLMAAFISFDYRHLPPFISNSKQKGFTVQTDQYAAISVSEPMSKMIRRMNLYRRNGKLKVRAKKTRARLEKWKKADIEQFDKSLIKNPLDPLDLAEFIFKQ